LLYKSGFIELVIHFAEEFTNSGAGSEFGRPSG
jgi:hypothetical protein